jgi:hypothetical protein
MTQLSFLACLSFLYYSAGSRGLFKLRVRSPGNRVNFKSVPQFRQENHLPGMISKVFYNVTYGFQARHPKSLDDVHSDVCNAACRSSSHE